MIIGAEQINVPTISFFCDVPGPNHIPHERTNDGRMTSLHGVVHSLIYQMTNLIPPLTDIGDVILFSQAASLKTSLASWSSSLRILSSLLAIGPPLLLCIIDGYFAFESPNSDAVATRELLGVLQKTVDTKDKVFKVLFTNSRRAFSLVQEVSWNQSEIIEGHGRPGDGWAALSGRTFVDFDFDGTGSAST